MKPPRAITKVISSQKLFLATLSAVVITAIYLRLDHQISVLISLLDSDEKLTFYIRERISLFDKFGWLFVGIVVAYISGNVAQKHRAFAPDPTPNNNEED